MQCEWHHSYKEAIVDLSVALKEVIKCFREKRIHCTCAKCEFMKIKAKFLLGTVTNESVSPKSDAALKVSGLGCTLIQKLNGLFCGAANYYWQLISYYAVEINPTVGKMTKNVGN